MSRTWFTSDLHLGHEKLAELRGFDTIEEHDTAVIESLNDYLRDEDTLFILGDLSAGTGGGEVHALGLLEDELAPVDTHLILGNHDRAHPMHRKWVEGQRQLRAWNVFDTVSTFGSVRVNGGQVLLSHFPYTRDRAESRYMQWRLRDEGLPLIHGHLHTEDRFVGREIHIGWDAWQRPVELNEISAYLRTIEQGEQQ
ncbi:hypothetical protein N806_29820 [Rhodococcus sp. P27]|nr:hypothetical protein N806_29820 [Rhodococcus sp. P27]